MHTRQKYENISLQDVNIGFIGASNQKSFVNNSPQVYDAYNSKFLCKYNELMLFIERHKESVRQRYPLALWMASKIQLWSASFIIAFSSTQLFHFVWWKSSLLLCVSVDSTPVALLGEESPSVGEVHKRLAERHGNLAVSSVVLRMPKTSQKVCQRKSLLQGAGMFLKKHNARCVL